MAIHFDQELSEQVNDAVATETIGTRRFVDAIDDMAIATTTIDPKSPLTAIAGHHQQEHHHRHHHHHHRVIFNPFCVCPCHVRK